MSVRARDVVLTFRITESERDKLYLPVVRAVGRGLPERGRPTAVFLRILADAKKGALADENWLDQEQRFVILVREQRDRIRALEGRLAESERLLHESRRQQEALKHGYGSILDVLREVGLVEEVTDGRDG